MHFSPLGEKQWQDIMKYDPEMFESANKPLMIPFSVSPLKHTNPITMTNSQAEK
jgi:hypothetical protein